MSGADLIYLAREGLLLALVLSVPVVLAAFLTALLVNLFQAATQVRESTLTFLPKLIAVAITLAVTGPWILGHLIRFAALLLEGVPNVGHSL